MNYFIIYRTTTLSENNNILEQNVPNKIFEDEGFANNYYNKYLKEPKIYSQSKKVYWTYSTPKPIEMSEEALNEILTKNSYCKLYKKQVSINNIPD